MLISLKQKPEHVRHKIALGGAFLITLIIFVGWAFSKGFFGYSNTTVVTETKIVEKTISQAKSPIGNTKSTFSSVFSGVSAQYDALKESVASVIVPFITGIDVYNKQNK